MKKKNWTILLLSLMLMSVMALTACGGNNNASTSGNKEENGAAANGEKDKDQKPVKLTVGIWESTADINFWTEKLKAYTAERSHVTVELEKIPDNGGQYLKVRLAAHDLPDMFFLKPAHFQTYKEKLLPLDGLKAVENNKYPTVVDGKVLGLPLVSFSEYIYYHPSIFEELGLEVPTTLPEFEDVMAKIKEDGKYIPLSLGAKDAWTFYPFSEFGPHVLSGDEDYLANLAKTEEPFGEGSTFQRIAGLLKEMKDNKYAGPDALGISFEQSKQQFESNKAAMIAVGQWYYPSYMEVIGNDDDLGVFPMPFRATESDPLYSMTMADMNIGINSDSKQQEEAKLLLEWMLSQDVYTDYINTLQQVSTMNDVTTDLPFFNKWNELHPFETFIYNGTDEGFSKVKAAAQFDHSVSAQEVFAGKAIEKIAEELNGRWAKAVKSNQ
ncbi:ABC transporter substrate-binding protein [Paenibacillus chungangensis]|uniref:ABC transporter substrate-binding protein n=1 Tax=Paenibacillus chungangensis TaxID=696535 RepID=A0ABW3HTG5_9BACL